MGWAEIENQEQNQPWRRHDEGERERNPRQEAKGLPSAAIRAFHPKSPFVSYFREREFLPTLILGKLL